LLLCNINPYLINEKIIFTLTIISVLFISCAKRGAITGGPKDSIAPVIVKSNPKNYQTNFTRKTIRIDFSEYIKVKDINKQLIISPPMVKAPTVVPQGSASKFISITLNEDLKPNTTYSLISVKVLQIIMKEFRIRNLNTYFQLEHL